MTFSIFLKQRVNFSCQILLHSNIHRYKPLLLTDALYTMIFALMSKYSDPMKITMGEYSSSRKSAIIALSIMVPIPTISVIFSMNLTQGILGNIIWFLSKLMLVAIPLIWCMKVDKYRPDFGIKNLHGLKMGVYTGIGMSLVVYLAWLILGRSYLDYSEIKGVFLSTGLTNPGVYFGLAAYWIFLNSILEEFVFRWFIFEQAEKILSSNSAIFISAIAFTLHHTVAMSFMFPLWINLLASIGIFLGGCIWSWLYLNHRNIWSPYVSHMLVDVTLFAIGGWILLR